ncbi:MAG: hydrolase [Gammaproteobacteria bacterium HGW-Gammaproteobacteria-14]|nr:MAG: hydrolase [Gammaproteobacteria bacterium HGW-Gammaproteobacteria-14]
MDSVSQMALGAAVSVAVMGGRVPVVKAAVVGGLLGTLPDLDVVIDYGDAIRNMTFHRGESHSLFWLTLASPVAAWITAKLASGGMHLRHWWLAVWLVWITHVLLDAMTIYGTQLLLPFSNYPVGVGSIFIIDPLYTVPLLIGLGLACWRGNPRGLNANRNGLILSTLYLCWGVMAQQYVARLADQSLQQAGVEVEQRLVLPTPLNSLLWRVLVITPDGYAEGFYSLLEGSNDISFYHFDRGMEWQEVLADQWQVQRLAWFTHGFYKLSQRENQILVTDLRMGQEPYYFFNFVVASNASGEWQFSKPIHIREREDMSRGLRWIGQRIHDSRAAPLTR